MRLATTIRLIAMANVLIVPSEQFASTVTCEGWIRHGLHNILRSTSSSSDLRERQTRFCSDYKRFKESGENARAAASFIEFTGGLSREQRDIEIVHQAVCRADEGTNWAESLKASFVQAFDPAAVQAYERCLKAQTIGLVEEIEPSLEDPNVFTLSLRYAPPPPTQGAAKITGITITQSPTLNAFQKVTCEGPLTNKASWWSGSQLSNEALSMNCTRARLSGSSGPITMNQRQWFLGLARVTVHTNAGDVIADFPPIPFQPPVPPEARVPIGTIIAFSGEQVPDPRDGWMVCDGRPLDRTKYNELFRVIGTAHGSASGSTFNLPDYRGRFLRGVSTDEDGRDPDRASRVWSMPGGHSGARVGSVQADALKEHNHIPKESYYLFSVGEKTGTTQSNPAGDGYWLQERSLPVGDRETRPLNSNVIFLIKVR